MLARRFDERRMRYLPSMLTTSVIAIRMTASAPSAATWTGVESWNSVAMIDASVAAG